MAVRVGSARIDERGKASGGKAGDQTGREVAVENWYNHSLGWYIIRAKDDKVREKIAVGMEHACSNSNIGYDQGQNKTLWNAADDVGFDPGKVKTPCETDCARLVRVCVRYAGVKADDFYTGDELKKLKATGAFDIITDKAKCSTSAYLKRGDILVTRSKGHTVVVLDDGSETKKAKEAAKKKTTPAPAKKAETKKTTKKTTKKATVPTYKVGKKYKIVVGALNVRTGPGTGYRKKSRAELTADGRKHATKSGALVKGTVVTCNSTKTVSGNVWMKIPSGWVAAYYSKKTYIK